MSTPHKKPKAKNNAKPKTASKKSSAKNNAKQPAARKTSKAKSKKPTPTAKKPKAVPVYVVVRETGGESPAYTEPDIVFASKTAAQEYAEKLNREMRTYANPFEFCHPRYAVEGGETAFVKFLKKNHYPAPIPHARVAHHDWSLWWDHNYFAMNDQQRETVWDQLTKFNWNKVRATTME